MPNNFNARIKPQRPWLALFGSAALIFLGEGIQVGGATDYLKARAAFTIAAALTLYPAFYWPVLRSVTGSLRKWRFVGLMGVIGLITWGACYYLAPTFHDIDVSPKNIDFSPASIGGSILYRRDVSLLVHNYREEVQYQIWIKLLVDSPSIETKDISFAIPSNKVDADRKRTILRDTIIYFGMDLKNQKVIYIVLKTLLPKETVPIELTNTYTGIYAKDRSHRAAISIVGFSDQPSPVLEGANGITVTFSPPKSESFTLMGVKVLVGPAN